MMQKRIDSSLLEFMDRRRFLKVGLASTAATFAASRFSRRARALNPYVVGVGRNRNPYVATQRAIEACGEWPALDVAGKTVIIKPNLVRGFSLPQRGVVTNVAVTRAVIDRALSDGAAQIILVETSPTGANFDSNGYRILRNYDPFDRIDLIDLGQLEDVLTPVPNGSAYAGLYMPEIVTQSDVVFISIGKLKTHQESVVTLTNKNMFGLPSVSRYITSESPVLTQLGGRFGLHDRGLHQAIVDINLTRSTHFAIIDGSWAMEGDGPLNGESVRMDTVLAGRNNVAVDRVGLAAMEIPDELVLHLAYAAGYGLGPASLADVTIRGDTLKTRPFQLPIITPIFEMPRVSPQAFRPTQGETATIAVTYHTPVRRSIHIAKTDAEQPDLEFLCTLKTLELLDPETEEIAWDGRADDGTLLPPGTYSVIVRGFDPLFRAYRFTSSIGWVTIGE